MPILIGGGAVMEPEPEERPGHPPGPADSDVLRCSRREQDGWVVIGVVGEIDWATAPILRRALAGPLTRPSPRVVLDLSGVFFLDSSGLSVIIRAHQQSRKRGGRLVVAGAPPSVRKILRITDTDRILSLCDTVGEAIERVALGPSQTATPVPGISYGVDDWLWPGGPGTHQIGLN